MSHRSGWDTVSWKARIPRRIQSWCWDKQDEHHFTAQCRQTISIESRVERVHIVIVSRKVTRRGVKII